MIVVCGAAGFVGGHLVGDLLSLGETIRAVDSMSYAGWYQLFETKLEDGLEHTYRWIHDMMLQAQQQMKQLQSSMRTLR